jgi:hypothetical protein
MSKLLLQETLEKRKATIIDFLSAKAIKLHVTDSAVL